MAEHAFRTTTDGGYFVFACRCGTEHGRQPAMSHARGREAHRQHVAEMRSASQPASISPPEEQLSLLGGQGQGR